MPDTDPVAATLERIRAELRTFGASDDDTRRLLAALDAVLALHVRRDEPTRTHHICGEHVRKRPRAAFLPEWRKAIDACPDCTVTEKYVCAHCRHECPDADEWPCPTYRAIAAALTGEKAGDEYR